MEIAIHFVVNKDFWRWDVVAQFLFVTDLDNTLVGDDLALMQLNERLDWHRREFGTKIVYSTGRSPILYQELLSEKSLLAPDALVTGVGTAIFYGATGEPDPTWKSKLEQGWNRDQVIAMTAHFADLVPQPESEQGAFKVSYYLTKTVAEDTLPELRARLKDAGLQVTLIYSGDRDLDILPEIANKGSALQFLRRYWQFDPIQTVVCGDSGNDLAMFAVAESRGIIVGNAMPELLEWHNAHPSSDRYLAKAHCANGILEGLHHFGFLD